MTPTALLEATTMVHLSPVELVIIVFYFALVLAIGLYLWGQVFIFYLPKNWRGSLVIFSYSDCREVFLCPKRK
jgi:hypothetical protein